MYKDSTGFALAVLTVDANGNKLCSISSSGRGFIPARIERLYVVILQFDLQKYHFVPFL